MLLTPLGTINLFVHNEEVGFTAIKLDNLELDLRQYLGHKKVKSVSERHPFLECPVSSETSQVKDRT